MGKVVSVLFFAALVLAVIYAYNYLSGSDVSELGKKPKSA